MIEDMPRPGIERWTGLVMIGDGLAGLIWPREYLRKLQVGPKPLNEVLEACAQRPTMTRALCVVEMAFGAWIFARCQAENVSAVSKLKQTLNA